MVEVRKEGRKEGRKEALCAHAFCGGVLQSVAEDSGGRCTISSEGVGAMALSMVELRTAGRKEIRKGRRKEGGFVRTRRRRG